MANEITQTNKYLDYTGLGLFLTKLKEYIENRISEINGTNLNLNESGTNNPTITSQIEELWAAIGSTDGSDGSIIENIEKILGEYVKSISTPTSQSQPLKLVIMEGTGDDEGRFTIELQDNGLNETLSTLTSARVSKITPANDGGAVTLSVDNNTGDVTLTVNSKALTERIETLESRSGKYNANKSSHTGCLLVGANNSDGWYDISSTVLRYNLTTDECSIGAVGRLTIGPDIYGGISLGTMTESTDSFITIAHAHPYGGISIDSSSLNIGSGISIGSSGIKIGSGGINIGSDGINIGTFEPTTGSGSINIDTVRIGHSSGDIVLEGRNINLRCLNGVIIGGVAVGTSNQSIFPDQDGACIKGHLLGTAQNSLRLGGFPYSHYATASSHTALKERVDSLEADRIKSVTKGTSTENYLTLGVSTIGLNTTITINDTSLKEKIEEIDAEMDTFAKSESIPTKLPNPEPLTVMWINDKNTEQTITYDGSEASEVDLTAGVYYATTSTTATRVSNLLTIVNKTGSSIEYNGAEPVTIYSVASAGNADKLGGRLPSYYAKKSELNTLSETVSTIDARVTTNTTNISNEVTARQNADNALGERLDTIESSYVKSVKVTGANGITATPTTATNGEVSISISGQELKESIEALGKVVNLTGVYAEGTVLNTISGNDGDFIIVGQKEYVYWSTATTGVDDTKWVLLGDTTRLSQDVSNLTTSYNNHTHTFTGDLNTTSDNVLTISYNSGKLNINTLHNHTVTPTGEISGTTIKPETPTIKPETPATEVEINEASINILSNVGITEDSITITGDNITIENNENNYNLIIE